MMFERSLGGYYLVWLPVTQRWTTRLRSLNDADHAYKHLSDLMGKSQITPYKPDERKED